MKVLLDTHILLLTADPAVASYGGSIRRESP